MLNMECAGEFTMTIALDTPAEAITAGWNERRVREAGGRIETDYEDETYYIRLTTAPADPDPVVRDLEVDV